MRVLAITCALLLFASLAHADGIGLYVGADCGTPETSITNACTSNAGSALVLTGTIVVPAATKKAFVGTVAILAISNGTPLISNWWRLDTGGGQCRGYYSALSAVLGPTLSTPQCTATIWDNKTPQQTFAIAQTTYPSQERIYIDGVLAEQDYYDFAGDDATELMDFRLTVSNAASVGTGSCSGCTQGACIVLNEIHLEGANDLSPSDFLRVTTPLNGRNYVAYQPGAPAGCGIYATPARNRTWGALKSLYR
jgi:hypothetical protein